MTNPPLKTKIKHFAPFLVLLALIGVAWMSGVHTHFSLAGVQAHGDVMRAMVADHPVLAALAFVAGYAVLIILCLPVASFANLLGGFLFGTFLGGTWIILGNTLGSFTLFMVARSSMGGFLRDRARGFYARIADQMDNNAASYLLFMRLVPAFPSFVTGVVPALFRVSPALFLTTTIIGTAPVAYIYAYLGQKLGSVDTLAALFSPGLAAALFALGGLALLPIMLQKLKKSRSPRHHT